jgi:HK97 gp10 family phage protein
MAGIKITADTKELNKLLEKRLEQNAMRELKKKMNRSVMLVHGTVVDSIQRGSKSGKTYQLTNPKRTHTASAAGEAPATDTGYLVSNITHQVKKSGNNLVGQIVASAPYAIHLEFGTRNMAKRPFLQPALKKNQRKIERIFNGGGFLK